MANKVSFLIMLKNRFTAAAKQLKNDFTSIDKKANKASVTLDKKLQKALKTVSFASQKTSKELALTTKKTEDLSGELLKVDKRAKNTGFALTEDLGTSIKRLKKEFGGMIQGLLTFATVTKTLSVGGNFQDAMAELSAITGAEGSNLTALGNDIFRMSKRFGIAQDVVAQAFTQTASAKSELLGVPGAVATVTGEALRLSKAAGIEVPDAIRASVGALNQFSLGADQAGRFVNVIAAGAKVGASQVGETAEALKNAGTVAAQLGLTFEQTNAILQVFAKNEVKGAEAGTALRGVLSKLEKFQKGAFAPSKVGIIRSLEMIEKLGLSNIDIIDKFGEENQRSILILRKNIPLIKQWTTELTGTNVATEQANIRLGTFNQKIIKAGTSLKSIGIKVFTGFEPILTRVVKLFTFLLNAIEGVSSALGNLIGQFAGAVATFDFTEFDFRSIASSFGEAFGLDKIPELNVRSIGERASEFIGVTPSFGEAFGLDKIPELNVGSIGERALEFTGIDQNINGTLNGEIVVSAQPGAEVKRTKMASSGNNLNLGVNMVTN